MLMVASLKLHFHEYHMNLHSLYLLRIVHSVLDYTVESL